MIGTQRRPIEKRGISFEKWNPEVTEFQPHPFSLEVYGSPTPEQVAEMKTSILTNGLITPILVWNKQVISGTTRWAAMRELHEECPGRKDFHYIPTNTFDGTDIEVEQKIIEANRQRVKTESQKDAEAAALLRIETELAKERQKQGRQNLADPSTAGKALEKVANVTGESTETIRKRVKIHAAGINPAERNQQSTSRAFESLPKPTACDICQAPFESKGAMKEHRNNVHADEMAKRRPLLPTLEEVNSKESPSLREPVGAENLPEELIESDEFVTAVQALIDRFPHAIDVIRFDYHRKPNVTVKNGQVDIQYYWSFEPSTGGETGQDQAGL